jgi:putative colanic acid biosynthesis acetyltransferase WcaF
VKTFDQESPYDSPWPLRQRIAMLAWEYCWMMFCAWTPKPFNRWRLLWLRLFGAKIHGLPFVHQRARIQIPWNLTMHDRASLGDRTNVYSLGEIEIGARAVVAQEAYLCGGTHDLADPNLPLQVAKISIGEDAFVAARAFVMPGVTIGARAVVGACAVVTKDVAPSAVVAGNPAVQIKIRGSAAA